MVNMYEVIDYLCKQRGISVAEMCRGSDVKQNIITELKHGRTKRLTYPNLVKIANYFEVSVDIFSEGVLEDSRTNECDAKDVAGFHYLAGTKKGEFEIKFSDFAYAMENESRGLTQEDKALLISMAKQLSQKRNGQTD